MDSCKKGTWSEYLGLANRSVLIREVDNEETNESFRAARRIMLIPDVTENQLKSGLCGKQKCKFVTVRETHFGVDSTIVQLVSKCQDGANSYDQGTEVEGRVCARYTAGKMQ